MLVDTRARSLAFVWHPHCEQASVCANSKLVAFMRICIWPLLLLWLQVNKVAPPPRRLRRDSELTCRRRKWKHWSTASVTVETRTSVNVRSYRRWSGWRSASYRWDMMTTCVCLWRHNFYYLTKTFYRRSKNLSFFSLFPSFLIYLFPSRSGLVPESPGQGEEEVEFGFVPGAGSSSCPGRVSGLELFVL